MVVPHGFQFGLRALAVRRKVSGDAHIVETIATSLS